MDSGARSFAPPLSPLPDSFASFSDMPCPTKSHVDDQDTSCGQSSENGNAHEESGVYNYGEPRTRSQYQYQGDIAVILEDLVHRSPYEKLVNGSLLGGVNGYCEPTYGDPAVLASAKLRGKRPRMVYDWEGKEELCYKLYITENKSLEEIMEFFKLHQDFTPRYVGVEYRVSSFALATACDLACRENSCLTVGFLLNHPDHFTLLGLWYCG